MPVYEYECTRCGAQGDYFQPIRDRFKTPVCCGIKTRKVILAPSAAFGDIPPYQSPVSGRVIGSRAARRDDLARTHSRPWEGREQEEKHAARQRAYAEAELERKVEDTAHRVYNELPPSKRRLLEGG